MEWFYRDYAKEIIDLLEEKQLTEQDKNTIINICYNLYDKSKECGYEEGKVTGNKMALLKLINICNENIDKLK